MSEDSKIGPGDVIAFWREAGRDKWFKKDPEFDRAIEERFGALHAEAAAGKLNDWAKSPEGALALILVLDQFSRNMFRDSPRAFAQDEMASEPGIGRDHGRIRPEGRAGTGAFLPHALHAFGADRGSGAKRPLFPLDSASTMRCATRASTSRRFAGSAAFRIAIRFSDAI